MTAAAPLVLTAPAGPRPLFLRRVAPRVAVLQSALMRFSEPLQLSARDAQIMVGLDAPRAAAADQPWLSFTLNGAPAAIQLPWGIARRLAGESVEAADPDDAALLVEEGLADWLDEAEAATGLMVRAGRLGAAPAALPVAAALNLQGRDGTRRTVQLRMPVQLSLPAAQALADAVARRAAARANPAGLVLRVFSERDAARLTCAELRSLRPGDAIVFSERKIPDRAVIEGRLAAPAMREPGGLRLTGAFLPVGDNMHQEGNSMTDAEAQPLSEAALDEIEVRVSFRAGEAQLDLRTLRTLGPGAIVETTESADAVVDIVVNGRVVGTGELIDVAGRRAIQIRTIFAGG